MAKLKLKARVLHMPGIWGTAVPVSGANVEVSDIDIAGKGTDLLWTGATNTNGYFQGESKEWQDTTTSTSKVWVPSGFGLGKWETKTVTITDATDILSLVAKITQKQPSGQKSAELPLIYINDNTESPSLVVPWGPPPASIANVNGKEVYNVLELASEVRSKIDSNTKKITIKIYSPYAEQLQPVIGKSQIELKKFISQKLGIPLNNLDPIVSNVDPVDVIIALAIFAVAIGASIAIILLAIAVVIAVLKGYQMVKAEQTTEASTGRNTIRIELGKT
jgi:hypothetical protein